MSLHSLISIGFAGRTLTTGLEVLVGARDEFLRHVCEGTHILQSSGNKVELWLFHNGKQFKGCFKAETKNQYRALCEIGGKLCIVDCARNLPFGSFLSALKSLCVKNAIYCDMGLGWNYSWYRLDSGEVKELFRTPGKYTTNWLTFYSY